MPIRIRIARDLGEFRAAAACLGHYVGWHPDPEDVERFSQILPLERVHVALDGTQVVGAAGAYPLEMTIPGGTIRAAGTTVVGVLPTHRRRGLLRRLMTAQLHDARLRDEPVAVLWASEETIYGRFGFGMASTCLSVRADRPRAGLRDDLPREGRVRLVDHDEALRAFPQVYQPVRRSTVGFLARSEAWWAAKPLGDRPEQRRGGGPLHRALLEIDGRPAGYALYRVASEGSGADWRKIVRVVEAIGVDARATREIWRYLLEIDWTDEVSAWMIPVDHPLRLLTARINALQAREWDALWLRPIDVAAALAGRGYETDGRVTLDVAADPLFGDNAGTWTIEDGGARRTRRRPDVALDVQALGAAYLGGFSFAELARAGLVAEASRGGLARADALFRTDAAPWCPENF